jgi:hypothetical protein
LTMKRALALGSFEHNISTALECASHLAVQRANDLMKAQKLDTAASDKLREKIPELEKQVLDLQAQIDGLKAFETGVMGAMPAAVDKTGVVKYINDLTDFKRAIHTAIPPGFQGAASVDEGFELWSASWKELNALLVKVNAGLLLSDKTTATECGGQFDTWVGHVRAIKGLMGGTQSISACELAVRQLKTDYEALQAKIKKSERDAATAASAGGASTETILQGVRSEKLVMENELGIVRSALAVSQQECVTTKNAVDALTDKMTALQTDNHKLTQLKVD